MKFKTINLQLSSSFLLLFLLIASCGLLRKNEVVHHEVIKDSTIYRSEIHFDTVVIKKDTFSGSVPLEILQKLNEISFRGERTTTKIIYRNGIISFKTNSDSLFTLIQKRIEKFESYQLKNQNDTKIIYKKQKSYRWEITSLSILAILIIIYLIIKKLLP